MDWSHVGDVFRDKRVLRLGRVHVDCWHFPASSSGIHRLFWETEGTLSVLKVLAFQDSVSSSPWDMKDSKILHFSTSTRTAQTSHKRIGLLQQFGPKMQVVLALVLVTKSSNGPKKNFYNPKRRPIHRVQRSRHAYTAFSRFNKGFLCGICKRRQYET